MIAEYTFEKEKYCECLYDIKMRISVLEKFIKQKKGQYRIIYIEYVCLQIRKILENIALISLVANAGEYAKQHKKFAEYYHARLIIRDLERINPDFFPEPVELTRRPDDILQFVKIGTPYLTKDKLIDIYETCAKVMHAQNPYSGSQIYINIDAHFIEWINLIKNLLNEHIITLSHEKILIRAVMQSTENGHPQAYVFERVGLEQNVQKCKQ